MTAHTFQASWPIEDMDRTQADLIREAEAEVPDLLFDARAAIVGPLEWRVTEAWKAGRTPMDGGPLDELVLMLTAPAAPWVDTVRPPRGRPRG